MSLKISLFHHTENFISQLYPSYNLTDTNRAYFLHRYAENLSPLFDSFPTQFYF